MKLFKVFFMIVLFANPVFGDNSQVITPDMQNYFENILNVFPKKEVNKGNELVIYENDSQIMNIGQKNMIYLEKYQIKNSEIAASLFK